MIMVLLTLGIWAVIWGIVSLVKYHEPNPVKIRKNAEKSLAKEGQKAKKVQDPYYQSLLNENPNDPRTWVFYGKSRGTRGDVKGAMKAFRHALRMDNQNLEAKNAIHALCSQMGKPHLAENIEEISIVSFFQI